MKYYLSRADPSVRARAWAGVVLPPIPRRLYVAPLHGILYRPVAIHSHFLLIQTLRQVVLGIARLPRVRASRLAEVVSLDVDRELAKRRGRRVADVVLDPFRPLARATVFGTGPRRQCPRHDARAAISDLNLCKIKFQAPRHRRIGPEPYPSPEAGDAVLPRGAARPPDPKGHQSTALLKKRRGRSVR